MSSDTKREITLKTFLGAVGVFVFFGFLALILSGFAGHESFEDRVAEGEFDEETIETRWKNLEEVEKAQAEVIDPAKMDAALSTLLKQKSAGKKTEIVVPGSPTFLKQSAAPAPAPNEGKAEEVKPAASSPAADQEPKNPNPTAKPAGQPEAEGKPDGAPEAEASKAKPAEQPKPTSTNVAAPEKKKADAKPEAQQ